MPRTGFIGLGSMGAPMALRLIAAGHELIVHDRAAAALARFADRSAIAATAAACADADYVVVMVATDAQARDAVLGEDGLASGLRPGPAPLILVMSTLLPVTITALAEAVAQKGARLIDAPVSGGPAGAREGTLSVMLGGGEAELALARPVLDPLARQVSACGSLGSGALAKIANNVVGIANTYLLAEALALGARLGLDPARLACVMDASSGSCAGTRDWPRQRSHFAELAASPGAIRANLDICRKDLAYALALAKGAGLQTPLLAHLHAGLAAARDDEVTALWAGLVATDRADPPMITQP